jgi:hypothetical protein
MVESIYFLKPGWCGAHLAGLWPEQGLQPVTIATALQAVVFTLGFRSIPVQGFYDGDGQYRIRFMPDTQGEWS